MMKRPCNRKEGDQFSDTFEVSIGSVVFKSGLIGDGEQL